MSSKKRKLGIFCQIFCQIFLNFLLNFWQIFDTFHSNFNLQQFYFQICWPKLNKMDFGVERHVHKCQKGTMRHIQWWQPTSVANKLLMSFVRQFLGSACVRQQKQAKMSTTWHKRHLDGCHWGAAWTSSRKKGRRTRGVLKIEENVRIEKNWKIFKKIKKILKKLKNF